MAKISSIERNRKRRRLSAKYAAKRERLKAIASDESMPQEDRFSARLKLAELPRNSAIVRVRNRCEITGRPRGITASSKCRESPFGSFRQLGRCRA